MRIQHISWIVAAALHAQQPWNASTPLPEPLTNASVIQLASAGYSEDYLISLIGRSRTQFDTSAHAFNALQSQGINDRIVGAMLAAPGTPSTKALAPKIEEAPPVPIAPPSNSIFNLWGLFQKIGLGAPRESTLVAAVAAKAQPAGRGASPLQIESEQLPRGIQGMQYEAEIRLSLDGRCPKGDSGVFLASGTLPRGVRTTAEGLAGVPLEMGLFRFWLGSRNMCATTTHAFELLVTGRPILHAIPDHVEITVNPDDSPVGQSVLISSTWPDLAYSTFPRDPSWIRLRQAQGTTPSADSALVGDRVTITALPLKLAPGVHHGTVIVSAWRADPITIDVIVNVAMPKPPPDPGPWNTKATTPSLTPP